MTQPSGRVRVYIACSLDGFIAGPHDELEWLTQERPGDRPLAAGAWASRQADGLSYEEFTSDIGAMLMGRGTYDVVAGFDEWYYGDLRVLVATSRPLENAPSTVSALTGDITNLVDAARAAANGKDVYVDGGSVNRQCLDAGLVDELTVTVMPTVLGHGRPLFAGTTSVHEMTVMDVSKYESGMIQLHMRPAGARR